MKDIQANLDELKLNITNELNQNNPVLGILEEMHKQFNIPYKLIMSPSSPYIYKYPMHAIVQPQFSYTEAILDQAPYKCLNIELKYIILKMNFSHQVVIEYTSNSEFYKHIVSQINRFFTTFENLKQIPIIYEPINESLIVLTPIEINIEQSDYNLLYNVYLRFKLGVALSEHLRTCAQQYCKQCDHVLTCMLKPDQSTCNLYLLTKEFKNDQIKKRY